MLIEYVFEDFNNAVNYMKKLRNKSTLSNITYYQYEGKYYVVWDVCGAENNKNILT